MVRVSITPPAARSSRRGSATVPTLHVVSRDTAFRQIRAAQSRLLSGELGRERRRLAPPRSVSESETYQLIVVPNWLAEFRGRLAASRH